MDSFLNAPVLWTFGAILSVVISARVLNAGELGFGLFMLGFGYLNLVLAEYARKNGE